MALSFRAVSAVTQVLSGDITLVEPTGAATGDLLVAVIAYRSNAAFALPAGWTSVAEENQGDIQTVAAGISSIKVAYMVRGATAPSYLFTRTGGDVARGSVAAYQPTLGGVPTLDSVSSTTMGASGGVLTLPSITTTNAGCVIIGCMSGVRGNASPNWSLQANATDPTTHAERQDTSSTGGADLSSSISDAPQAVPGATGAFTATCVFSGRHCGALAAFYEVVGNFPTIVNVVTTSTSTTSHVINLPPGMVAGNMCIVQFLPGTTASVVTWPGGWTVLAATTTAPSTHFAYRIIDGTEGATITVSSSVGTTGCAIANHIRDAHLTQTPEILEGSVAGGAGSANPPALTASWGAEANLWIAAQSSTNQNVVTGNPAGYTLFPIFENTGGSIATAGRTLIAATDDPGLFTFGGTANRRGTTLVLRPATTGAYVPGDFPVIADYVGTSDTTASVPHTVALPTGIVAGDLCLVITTSQGAISWTFPAGWTEVLDSGGQPNFGVAYRICDGSEGASITVTLSASNSMNALVYRITGAHQVTPPETAVVAPATATSSNPPALTPAGWNPEKTLWLAASSGDGTVTPTAYPTGYTYHQTTQGGGATGGLAVGALQQLALTQDPSVFTYAASTIRRAVTIAIRPAPQTAAPVTGTIAQTTGITAQDASGTVTAAPAITGTVAQTLAPAQQAASGTVTAAAAVTGTIVQAITRAAQALSGTVTAAPAITGTAAQTLSPAQQSASGTVTAAAAISGTVVQAITRAAQAASGTVTAAPAVTGTVVQTLSPAQQAATGSVASAGAIIGQIDQTITRAAQALAGTVTAAPAVTGTIVQAISRAQQAATGTMTPFTSMTGIIAQTAPSATQAAVGTVGGVIPDQPVRGGGFANWSTAVEKKLRKKQKERNRERIELREILERAFRGEPEDIEIAAEDMTDVLAIVTDTLSEPDIGGLRAELQVVEVALRQALAAQEYERQIEMQRLDAMMAAIQEEEAIVSLLA